MPVSTLVTTALSFRSTIEQVDPAIVPMLKPTFSGGSSPSEVSVAVAVGLAALAACNQGAQEEAADNIEANAEMTADNLEEMADETGNEATEDALENQADALEAEGERREEAIDEADVNAASPAQANAAVNAM